MNNKLAALNMRNDVMHALQVNLYELVKKADFKLLWRHMVVAKNLDDEIKNIAGEVLTYNSKNIIWIRAAKLDQPTYTIDWTKIISITWTLVYAVKLCFK